MATSKERKRRAKHRLENLAARPERPRHRSRISLGESTNHLDGDSFVIDGYDYSLVPNQQPAYRYSHVGSVWTMMPYPEDAKWQPGTTINYMENAHYDIRNGSFFGISPLGINFHRHYVEQTEELFDDVTGFQHRWKPCCHQKLKVKVKGGNPHFSFHKDIVNTEKPVGFQEETIDCEFSLPLVEGCLTLAKEGLPFPTCLGSLPPEEVGNAIKYALSTMEPRIENASQSFQLPVFLLEFADTKRLVESLLRSRVLLMQLLDLGWTSPRALKGALKTTASLSVKSIADLRLTISYAIEPFIADVAKLHKAVFELVQYLNKWNSDANTQSWRVRHFDLTKYLAGLPPFDMQFNERTDVCIITDEEHLDTPNEWTPSVSMLESKCQDVKVTVGYGFVPVSFDMTSGNLICASCDALGLGDGLSLVWEMVPFSFLLDYFVSVSKFLNQLDKDFAHLQTRANTVLLTCVSNVECSVRMTATCGGESQPPVVAKVSRKLYERQRWEITDKEVSDLRSYVTASAIDLKLPSLGQLKNMVALLTAGAFRGARTIR